MDELTVFQGRRVTVMGLGRFGGGVAAARFLAERGARVTISDLKSDEELADSLAELDDVPIHDMCLGHHRETDFTDVDLVVVNPAVPPRNPLVQAAARARVPLTSEIALFWQFNRGRTLGVTGSNGKSTTTGLVDSILQADGRTTWLGGNIGRSLLPEIDRIQPEDWVVLELSSFQLCSLDQLFTSPEVSVITNLAPNHLDWHESMGHYRWAKQAMLRWQSNDATAVLNASDLDVSHWITSGRRLMFGYDETLEAGLFSSGAETVFRDHERTLRLPLRDWVTLPGQHNFENAMAATCAALAIGVSESSVQAGLQAFRALPHRLEFVAEVAGRRFYNDSLATTPESARAALDAFTEPVIILAGGYDKHVDLTEFADAIAHKTKAAALMGQTAEVLAFRIDQINAGHGPP
ncbi:MAG: UDP-N-acetylmuramoyl-L-alanine--D-glutamate ligase, partial [Planctomycetota bacterium]|nr:UDP-N-acetylmuramoyl-L-alanine--D-glutamate ligase [Planctomycetota bacterium]